MTPADMATIIERAARDNRLDFVTNVDPATGETVYTLSFRGTIVGTMRIITAGGLRVQQLPARDRIPQHMRNRYKKAANDVIKFMFEFA